MFNGTPEWEKIQSGLSFISPMSAVANNFPQIILSVGGRFISPISGEDWISSATFGRVWITLLVSAAGTLAKRRPPGESKFSRRGGDGERAEGGGGPGAARKVKRASWARFENVNGRIIFTPRRSNTFPCIMSNGKGGTPGSGRRSGTNDERALRWVFKCSTGLGCYVPCCTCFERISCWIFSSKTSL